MPDQQPDIIIPPDGANHLQLVSKKDFEDHKKDFDFQKNVSTWTFGLIVAVVLVCFISFITFMIDSYKFHGETTKDFNNTVKELAKENSNLKSEHINERIETLKKEVEELKSTLRKKESNSQHP